MTVLMFLFLWLFIGFIGVYGSIAYEKWTKPTIKYSSNDVVGMFFLVLMGPIGTAILLLVIAHMVTSNSKIFDKVADRINSKKE